MYSKILKAIVIELMELKEKAGLPDDHRIMIAIAYFIEGIKILDGEEKEGTSDEDKTSDS